MDELLFSRNGKNYSIKNGQLYELRQVDKFTIVRVHLGPAPKPEREPKPEPSPSPSPNPPAAGKKKVAKKKVAKKKVTKKS